MSKLKLMIIVLLAANLLLLGLEASKPPPTIGNGQEAGVTQADPLPGIRLLSELADDANLHTRRCFTVGPFEGRPTVDAIVEMLGAYTTSLGSRETVAFVDRGYWVYLTPYADEQAARQAVKVLYDAGFEDVSIIKNGEWDNSISLGYFIDQSNAMVRKDQVRAMGFEAQTRIQREDETRYWVDYEQRAGVEYASRIMADMVPAGLHRPTACPEPADSERNTGITPNDPAPGT